jgi:glutamine synthetase
MTTAKDVMKLIKDNDVKYVDFRFHRSARQVAARHVRRLDDRRGHVRRRPDVRRLLDRRLEGDPRVRHEPDADPGSACIDPFFAETTLSLVCDVLEPTTGEPYNRDPRGIARRPRAMVKSMGVGDTIFFGPEPSSSSSMT